MSRHKKNQRNQNLKSGYRRDEIVFAYTSTLGVAPHTGKPSKMF